MIQFKTIRSKYCYKLVLGSIFVLLMTTGCRQEVSQVPPEVDYIDFRRYVTDTTFDYKERYHLGVGDILEFNLLGQQSAKRKVTVQPSGYVDYFHVGSVKAAGLTIDELRNSLQSKLVEIYPNSFLTITPLQLKSHGFSIFGEVKKPGVYDLESVKTVIDAIALSGGLKKTVLNGTVVASYDLERSVLVRANELVPIDFHQLLVNGDMSFNIHLQKNDIIVITKRKPNYIFLTGFLKKNGPIKYFGSRTLSSAIANVGGFLEEASGKVVIIRGSLSYPEIITVRFQDIINRKTADIMVKPGDILYAPRGAIQITKKIVRDAFVAYAAFVAETDALVYQKEIFGEPEQN